MNGALAVTLVVTLVIGTALAQGSVAVVAVTDLTRARWAGSMRRELLLAARFLPVLALAPVQQIPVAGGIELRYYLSTLWGLVALAALGFQEGLEWAAKHFKAWLEGKVLEHAAKDKRDNKN